MAPDRSSGAFQRITLPLILFGVYNILLQDFVKPGCPISRKELGMLSAIAIVMGVLSAIII
jgi:hypothetical protein